MQIESVMIAANANTVFKAIDYDQESKLVAYAASNQVLILDPFFKTARADADSPLLETPKVLFGLRGHTTRINAVQWLNTNLIVSIGGDEKVVTVWGRTAGADPRNPLSWRSIWTMKDAHPATINYLTTFKGESDSDLYFTTMCSEGVLKLWAGAMDGDQVTFALKSELLFGRNL